MEILVMVIFFIIAAAVQAAMKAAGNQQQRPRQPQWPGPVAGPRIPGYPQMQRPPAPPVAPPPTPRPAAPPRSLDDEDEGVSMEGVSSGEGTSMEGFGLGQTVEEEVALFQASTGHFGESEPIREQRADTGVAKPRTSGDLQFTGNSLAQAFVMAEVLGKPKALRNRE